VLLLLHGELLPYVQQQHDVLLLHDASGDSHPRLNLMWFA
jgi:hypothetical protein